MKRCELCKNPARAYCESDQASLCWDCDAKVHGANFLVARHSRTLLCDACQSPTPWKASGAELGNTVSVCRNCDGGMNFISGEDGEESDGDNYESNVDAEDSHDEDDAMLGEDDGCAEGGDEDGDNQVVPWSSSTPPPPASSSSSDESVSGPNNCNRDVSDSVTATSLKRRRHQDASARNFQVLLLYFQIFHLIFLASSFTISRFSLHFEF